MIMMTNKIFHSMPWCLFSGVDWVLAAVSPGAVVTFELDLGLTSVTAGISDIDRAGEAGRKQFLSRACVVASWQNSEQCRDTIN